MTDTFIENLTTAYDQPYRTEAGLVTSIIPPPAPFQVSIAGHQYSVDTEFKPYLRDAFSHLSIPAQREAIDLTNEPGQGTINVEDLWRRGQNNWILGAGQPYLDRKQSNPDRFWNSKGIETGFTWQLSLLPKARKIYTTPNAHVFVLCVGDTVYVLDTRTLKFSTDLTHWTTVTGTPPNTTGFAFFYNMCTNGNDIWLSYGPKGIWHTTVGAAAMTHFTTGTVTFVAWAGNCLVAGFGPKLWQVNGTGSLPTPPLFTHPNADWVWIDGSMSDSIFYIAGFVNIGGGSGVIYRSEFTTTGIRLQVPIIALPFEGGETPNVVFSYLNFLFVGTNLGIRMCRTLSMYDPSGKAGDLQAGALQPNRFQQIVGSVTGITGHGRFVYFTWGFTFDTQSAGIGRLDLENFVDQLTPAYASDMMVPKAGLATGVDWFASTAGHPIYGATNYNSPVYCLGGSGLWVNTPNEKVTSGFVESGFITYGVPDDKVALQLSLRAFPPLDGFLKAFMSVDERLSQDYSEVGETYSAIPPAPYKLTQIRGEQYQVKIELDSGGTGETPIFRRWILKSYPATVAGITFKIPIILFREVEEQGLPQTFDPYAEYDYLERLRQNQQVIQYVEGPFSRTVIITSLHWVPFGEQGNEGDRRGYNGDLVVYLKSFPTTTA